jgi:hypothetical protein
MPYFFKNNIIDDKVYLAHNTMSLKNAFYIYKTWIDGKYNPIQVTKDDNSSYGFMFYVYKNKDNIKGYYVNGETKTPMKIIGYKMEEDDDGFEAIGDMSLFTVLLPL